MIDGIYKPAKSFREYFDLHYYLEQLKQSGLGGNSPKSLSECVEHYEGYGWRKGISPSEKFDTKFYVKNNPKLSFENLSPLSHFVNFGQFEGRRAHASYDRTSILTAKGNTLWQTAKQIYPSKGRLSKIFEPKDDSDPLMRYFSFEYKKGNADLGDFDSQYYIASNSDVRKHAIEPFSHYLEYGFRERRFSSPGGKRLIEVDEELLEDINKVRLHLDEEFYRGHLPYLEETTIDLAAHFYFYGWKAELDPSATFSVSHYLDLHPDLRKRNVNPLVHCLENYSQETFDFQEISSAQTVVGDFNGVNLSAGFRNKDSDESFVNIILPVYRGYSETLSCLKSVLSSKNETPFKLIVLDDCSPEPELSKALSELAHKFGFYYLKNEQNIGFVSNVSKGFKLSKAQNDAHVIILNSDTVVYDRWIDLMREHYSNDDMIGTMTPLSNNATIMSYPKFCKENNYELEVSQADVANLASKNSLLPIEVPTGVGFAMFISKRALDAIGGFDEDAFGRGYGEEVDFCQKVSLLEFKNVALPNVFVTHLGSVSFASEKEELSREAQKTLDSLYPSYHLQVKDFIHVDPLLPAREYLDIERLVKYVSNRPFLVSFSHNLGGGIQKYIDDVSALAKKSNVDVININIADFEHCRISFSGCERVLNLRNLNHVHFKVLEKFLERLLAIDNCRAFLINSLIGTNARFRKTLLGLAENNPSKTVSVIHDFSFVCLRANLVDSANIYRGGFSEIEKCMCCKDGDRPEWDVVLSDWRQLHAQMYQASRAVIVPDEAVVSYVPKAYNLEDKLVVRPHDETKLMGSLDSVLMDDRSSIKTNSKTKLAIIGAIGPHKGSRLLSAMKREILKRDLPLELHLIGYADLKNLTDNRSVFVHGAYSSETEALQKLKEIGPMGALSLSIWPEAYCYSLSILIAAGLPILGIDIGAQGTRLNKYSRGDVMDYSVVKDVKKLLTTIMSHDWTAVGEKPIDAPSLKMYKSLEEYLPL